MVGMIADGLGGDHGRILVDRRHHRYVFETTEVPSLADIEQFNQIVEALGDLVSFPDSAEKSWYKLDDKEVNITRETGPRIGSIDPLSHLSTVVRGLRETKQLRVYVRPDDRDAAREIVSKRLGSEESR
ncbi:MAG: hypothetical protein HY331_13125 [Chloroflexi bacterium]|nr:hypothetical protein [Chloroflexota bacterium]